jgi:hypothetical protein
MNKLLPRAVSLLLLFMFVIVVSQVSAADSTNTDLEDTMAGVKLGSKVDDLKNKYPNIYRNQLFAGEILYEACNQKQLEVFSFTEEPWSRGYITNIWVRQAEESVCRDSTGGLPDYSIPAVTPRGVKLGDKEENVIRLYGQPDSSKIVKGGDKILTYKAKNGRKNVKVKNLVLYFTIRRGSVSSFHLVSDMPGAKKPF